MNIEQWLNNTRSLRRLLTPQTPTHSHPTRVPLTPKTLGISANLTVAEVGWALVARAHRAYAWRRVRHCSQACGYWHNTPIKHFGHNVAKQFHRPRYAKHSRPIWYFIGISVTFKFCIKLFKTALNRTHIHIPHHGLSLYTVVEKVHLFTAQCTLVQSAVLGSHVVCLSVCLSVTLRWWFVIT